MCQYCEDRYPLDSDYMLFEIVNWQGKQPAILVQYSAPDTYSSVDNLVVPIKFCPMCGRSLTPLAVDETHCACKDEAFINDKTPGCCGNCGKPFRH